MADKILKQIQTTCPFPILIYKTHIRFNEVRKPTGIAFIILKIIQGEQADALISEVLLKFGIPSDIHYLFGREIAHLIKTDILSSVQNTKYFRDPWYFAEIKVGDVKMTEKGEKMFRDGFVPLDNEKEKVKEICFSPVTRKFEMLGHASYPDIANSFLGENFMDRVEVDISGMEDYISANTAKVGLRAEERVVSVKPEDPQYKNKRQEGNAVIYIYPTEAEITFNSTDERAFFDKYYDSALLTKGMLQKNKYKFADKSERMIDVPEADISAVCDAVNLYIPSEFASQASQQCKVFLHKGKIPFKRSDNAVCAENNLSQELLDIIDPNAEFALLNDDGCRYFCAVNAAIPCKNFGDTLHLQLLTESKANESAFKKIVEKLYLAYENAPFDGTAAKVVQFAVNSLKSSDYFASFIGAQLKQISSADDKIAKLLSLHTVFKAHSEWSTHFKNAATGLFDESVLSVKLDNVIYKNTVLAPLVSALNMPREDYVRKFSEQLRKSESTEIVYEALESAGFSPMEILGVANLVEPFINAVLQNRPISSETELAAGFKTVSVNLWKLNGMLGIENSYDYTLREDFDTDEFFNVYSTMRNALKAIDAYSVFAVKECNELKRYLAIYEPVHELLAMERTSSSHPEKITKKFIDEYISRGKYKEAICDLLVKLQYDLREILHLEGKAQANELIDTALKKKIIEKDQADALHKLRICRNGLQHPERTQTPFDRTVIESWKEAVFAVKEEKK